MLLWTEAVGAEERGRGLELPWLCIDYCELVVFD